MSNAKDLMQQLTDLQKEYEQTAKQIGKPAFIEMSQKCFDKVPELQVIRWTQYAPHFNDGEACTFSVNCADFYRKQFADVEEGEEKVELEKDEYEFGYEGNGDLDSPAFKEFYTFIQSTLGEDLCERIFGEDAEVKIWRDGTIEVGEYEHD